MTGMQFLTDVKGRKTGLLSTGKNPKPGEDIQDVLVSRSRRNEKRMPLEKEKAHLVASGKLRA